MVKKGLSILELLVAIFLITIVIGTGLLIIAANLNVMKKSKRDTPCCSSCSIPYRTGKNN